MPDSRPPPMKLSPKQREASRLIADGKFYPCLVKEEDGWHARWRGLSSDPSLDGWVDEYVREAAMTRLTEDAEEDKHETLHDAWMMALKSRTGLVIWDDAECAAFAAELAAWSGNAAEDKAARAAIRFDLTPVGETFRLVCATPRGRAGLKALGQATFVFGPLRGLRAQKGTATLAVDLTRGEAEDFVRRGARDLRDAGYGVTGVDLAATVTASAEVEADDAAPTSETKARDVRFKLVVRVAGEPVTADEIRFLLDQGSTLVYFRDHWIEVDRNILKEALRALERGVGKKAHPLAFALGLGHVGKLELEEVVAHGWVRGLVEELKKEEGRGKKEEGREKGRGKKEEGRRKKEEVGGWGTEFPLAGFAGTLRDYQRAGVAWIRFMTEHGFGALLADDMGLGKTIQTIAWIVSTSPIPHPPSPTPHPPSPIPHPPILIVAPLTLLANWAHEFAKFAPGLKVYVHQGSLRHLASGFRRAACAADVVLTSYTLLVREQSAFASIAWDGLVLDEAQAIKNPDTQAARAVRALTPAKRLALTGTPIENSVADIWSIEEFLNPGFLGERKAFDERFAKPIAADEHGRAAQRLKRALEPFVLRRLKTDAGIAAELGPKREIREYCELLPSERRAYEAALEDFRAREREQGDVFALLTRLKLICDGDGAAESGKLLRLFELVGQIFANGESALVFTQYARVGAVLQAALEKRFGRRVPFLHGALDAARREALVRGFQASRRPGVFILSLKAGGFGLNLTKATHVIHYDRWWNPAVENQATDRAHRLGQTQTVFVHLFIAAGTVEERVDEILARKESLRDLVADGQAFWNAVRLG